MADQLLIRAFDVGLGDCVYCRIPDGNTKGGDFHILIDCGSLSGMEGITKAVNAVATLLPDAGDGRRRLDLLVVTHQHKDHMAGFGAKLWAGFDVGAVWMSAAMDPEHPEAAKAKKLHGFAAAAMTQALRLDKTLSPELRAWAEATSFNNDEAISTLRENLPNQSGITPTYVHAGLERPDSTLSLKGATISVLGPEKDIDFYYLGRDGDPSLRSMMGILGSFDVNPGAISSASAPCLDEPTNLDPADFRRLKTRMQSTALAFADLDGKVTNNTSVVLLIEWRGKRLLFVGDAEWDARYREGKGNCSWNVMWNKRREKLGKPVDFLKIGHHGSINATPWADGDPTVNREPVAILDAILPVSRKQAAQAVVSTRRSNYETIPCAGLLAELGTRVGNTKNYAAAFNAANLNIDDVPRYAEYEREYFEADQPLRTDMIAMLDGDGFIDILIDP